MLIGAIITGIVTYAILALHRFGFRTMETVIGSLVGVIAVCYVAETLLARPNWHEVLYHSVVPWLGGSSSVVACGGSRRRNGHAARDLFAFRTHARPHRAREPAASSQARAIRVYRRRDRANDRGLGQPLDDVHVGVGLSRNRPRGRGRHHDGISYVDAAVGNLAAFVFLISLMASGISSSVVGTMAGQVIMQGFVGFAVPLWVRRLVTMLPAIGVVALGLNVTETLVFSQVALSFVLPIPVITLVLLTARRQTMGAMVNRAWVTWLAAAAAAAICALNAMLIWTVIHPG